MSKQSKQERAKKYAESAIEAVRLAGVVAGKANADLLDLLAKGEAVDLRITAISKARETAESEIVAMVQSLDAISARRKAISSEVDETIGRLAKAEGTMQETAMHLRAIYREPDDAPAETTTPADDNADPCPLLPAAGEGR